MSLSSVVVSSSSGRRRGRNRISKRGSRLARHQLYLLAGRLGMSVGVWHGTYLRLRARGARKKEALIALSRKAVRVLFALARDRVTYEEPSHPSTPLLQTRIANAEAPH